jgi:hypothetical protein
MTYTDPLDLTSKSRLQQQRVNLFACKLSFFAVSKLYYTIYVETR